MDQTLTLQTARGAVLLRGERPEDADFLYRLFRSHMLRELALMPVDDTTRESLVRMQFTAQTESYRTHYPAARFDIIEHDGAACGRIVVDDDATEACIVDFALLPEYRGAGLGTSIMAAMLARLAGRKRPVRCKVLCNNEASLRMCLRVGFVQTGGELPFLQLEWTPPDMVQAGEGGDAVGSASGRAAGGAVGGAA